MNREEFIVELKKLCPWVDETAINLLDKYKVILQRENAKYNLTRLDKEDTIYSSYFLESLIPYLRVNLFTKESNYSLLDIGSGSGIPGIVLKIIFSNLKVTVLDSNNKKTEFLSLLVKELGLQDVEVIYGRAEELAQSSKYREKFDVVTSRAVSGLYKILELSAAFCKINGYIIQPKSLKADEEYLEAQGTIKVLHLQLEDMISFKYLEHQHHVFLFIKVKSTPSEYPRVWQQILKKPL